MQKAFSLVELSIVLVILGLLTGGILAGQSLIRAAELRSVTSEYNRYLTAVGAFRDKYFAIPGDMNNAISFWGAAHATPATCKTTAGTGTLTCNGNGDGRIEPTATSTEEFRFWQQLANAGLIEGSYSGITQGTNDYSSTTANSPVSKLGQGLWFGYWYQSLSGSSSYFDGSYGNFLMMGTSMVNMSPAGAILKPEEMWNLDVKMDDGKPASGKVMPLMPNGISNCTTGANSAALTADYLLSKTSLECLPLYRQAF